MRIIMFLILSSFLLSQPTTNNKDSVEISNPVAEIPADVKPVVDEIVIDSEEARKASSELNKEIQKQLDLMKQIKSKVSLSLKKPHGIGKITKVNITKKDSLMLNAIKPNDTSIYINGQLIKREYKKKTVFGIVFHSAYYPYIIDKNGNRVYLKQ